MVNRCDTQKRQAWEARLNRFRLSELTVAKFCDHERVSVHAFYYWSRRIRSASPETSTEVSRTGLKAGRRRTHDSTAADADSTAGLVRFRLNATVEVSIPADCLDAIRCLTECLAGLQPERSSAFQEVVVKA